MTAAAIAQIFREYGPWGVSAFMAWLFLREQKKRDDDRIAFATATKEQAKQIADLSEKVVTVATNANANNAGLIAVLGSVPRK